YVAHVADRGGGDRAGDGDRPADGVADRTLGPARAAGAAHPGGDTAGDPVLCRGDGGGLRARASRAAAAGAGAAGGGAVALDLRVLGRDVCARAVHLPLPAADAAPGAAVA